MQDMKQEILGLEKKYWNAMKEYDLDTALALTDFPCVVASEHGFRSVDRAEFEKMFKSNQGTIESVDLDEGKFTVRQVGPETAIAAYEVKSVNTREGKKSETNAVDTSTWIKKGEKWVCAMHTETELLKH